MTTAAFRPIPVVDGLRGIVPFEALLGEKFVQETAKHVSFVLRSARSDFERSCLLPSLHPLGLQFIEYLALKQEIVANRSVPVSNALLELAADAAALFDYRAVWDDGVGGSRRRNLVNRLKSREAALHCLYELRDAKHFAMLGAEVVVRSALMLPGHDLSLNLLGLQTEVECKGIYPWSGRKIPDPLFNLLFDAINRKLTPLSLQPMHYMLRCDDRLSREDFPVLLDAAWYLGATGHNQRRVDGFTLEATPLSDPSVIEKAVLTSRLEAFRASEPGGHIGVYALPVTQQAVRPLLAFSAVSRQQDDLIGHVVRTVRSAQKQLTGDCPAIVSIHIPTTLEGQLTPDPDAPLVKAFDREYSSRSLDKVSAVGLIWDGYTQTRMVHMVGGQALYLVNRNARHRLPQDLVTEKKG